MTDVERDSVDRGSVAERVQSTAERLAQIRERIARLQAGEHSTCEDVRRAQLAARLQRIQAARAERRVLAVRSGSAAVTRSAPPRTSQPGAAESTAAQARIRDALISIVAAQVPTGPVEDDRRRTILRQIVDRAEVADWHGWSQALCQVATSIMPSVRGVTVIAGVDGLPLPMGATDDWTREIEELHRTLGEGPALTAQQTGKPVIVAALEKESGRWPAWVAAATALGVTGMWSYPLIVGGARVGAITFHRTDQRQQGPSEISDARILVDLAGRLLWADADRIERGDADDDLQDYQTVNMAAGMVSVQLDIPIPDAVTRIRAHAFVNDQSITMVAGDIVERRLRLR
jgi:hypothetical protein